MSKTCGNHLKPLTLYPGCFEGFFMYCCKLGKRPTKTDVFCTDIWNLNTRKLAL